MRSTMFSQALRRDEFTENVRSTMFTEDEIGRLTARFKQGTPWHSWSHQRDDAGGEMIVMVDERPREQPLRIVKTSAGLYAGYGPRPWDVVVADEIEQLIDFLAANIHDTS